MAGTSTPPGLFWFRNKTKFCFAGRCLAVLAATGCNRTATPRSTPGFCAGGKLSLRIDRQPIQAWPQSESVRIGGLSTTARHRVFIYRDGKAQQSFTFRFAEFKSNTPCLFLNDPYWTAQLWEGKDAPWCKCRLLMINRLNTQNALQQR